MDKNEIIELIDAYITAYNTFNVDKMMSLMHESIVFENYTNGERDLLIDGLTQLREVAGKAVELFISRSQIVRHMEFKNNETIVEIEFKAKLAVDFSDQLKAGDTLQFPGKSIFRFTEGKISYLADYS